MSTDLRLSATKILRKGDTHVALLSDSSNGKLYYVKGYSKVRTIIEFNSILPPSPPSTPPLLLPCSPVPSLLPCPFPAPLPPPPLPHILFSLLSNYKNRIHRISKKKKKRLLESTNHKTMSHLCNPFPFESTSISLFTFLATRGIFYPSFSYAL